MLHVEHSRVNGVGSTAGLLRGRILQDSFTQHSLFHILKNILA